MSIYIVHQNAIPDGKIFEDMKDEEIIALFVEERKERKCCLFINKYDGIEELASEWNCDEIFYPSDSYMRVIDD
jgi:hypothetical protein